MENTFLDLAKINVSSHVENKGKFSYLSWPFAVSELSKYDHQATWEVQRFPLPNAPEIRVPYMETPLGFFVEVSVTVKGITRSQIHPVLDNSNKPIAKPNTFHINTSIQRALVKAIGLHGLGLYIYAGEDLPLEAPKYTKEQHDGYHALVEAGDALGLHLFIQNLSEEAEIDLFNSFADGEKKANKDKVRELTKVGRSLMEVLPGFIEKEDAGGAAECLEGITPYGKKLLSDQLGRQASAALGDLLKSLKSTDEAA